MKNALLVLILLVIFTPTVHAGMAPPEPIIIEMPMPRELSAVEQSLDDLACRGRVIRFLGRGVRGVLRLPLRHHR